MGRGGIFAPLQYLDATDLEFVPHCKLHYTWVGEYATEGAERSFLVKSIRDRRHIEHRVIQYVENLPAKLEQMGLGVGQLPGFTEGCIQSSEAGATKRIALT